MDAEFQLHTVPCRNVRVKHWPLPEDPTQLVVEVELKYRGFLALAAKIFGARTRKKYSLVGLAREVYEAIDGEQTVEDLINVLMTQHCLTFLEARALTTQYLSDLMKRGLVVIVG